MKTLDLEDVRKELYIHTIEGIPTLFWKDDTSKEKEWRSRYADTPVGDVRGRFTFKGHKWKTSEMLSRLNEISTSFGILFTK